MIETESLLSSKYLSTPLALRDVPSSSSPFYLISTTNLLTSINYVPPGTVSQHVRQGLACTLVQLWLAASMQVYVMVGNLRSLSYFIANFSFPTAQTRSVKLLRSQCVFILHFLFCLLFFNSARPLP